jgi:hypothetical protein
MSMRMIIHILYSELAFVRVICKRIELRLLREGYCS